MNKLIEVIKETIEVILKKFNNILSKNHYFKKLFIKIYPILSPLYSRFRYKPHNKIFGIGLSRTGTKSLTLALLELGYKAKHYPPIPEFFKLIKKHKALTDTSISYHFKLLDKKYPNSKFILTIRDIDTWLKSCQTFFTKPTVLREWQIQLRKKVYGTHVFNREKFELTYKTHVNNVIEYFKNRPNDFLILNVIAGDGYEKLCPFLGKPIFKKPFPHKNIGLKEKLNE